MIWLEVAVLCDAVVSVLSDPHALSKRALMINASDVVIWIFNRVSEWELFDLLPL